MTSSPVSLLRFSVEVSNPSKQGPETSLRGDSEEAPFSWEGQRQGERGRVAFQKRLIGGWEGLVCSRAVVVSVWCETQEVKSGA